MRIQPINLYTPHINEHRTTKHSLSTSVNTPNVFVNSPAFGSLEFLEGAKRTSENIKELCSILEETIPNRAIRTWIKKIKEAQNWPWLQDNNGLTLNTALAQKFLKDLIATNVYSYDFLNIITHPAIDIEKCNLEDLYHAINKVLDKSDKRDYTRAIKSAIKVNNARKTAKYYAENGEISLEQITKHVDNANDERAINLPLNDIGETIAHLLAETPVNKSDEQTVKDLIDKMRKACCRLWQEDALGRSPLMLALENKNLLVAKAMLEKMHISELSYCDDSRCGVIYTFSINDKKINHIPTLWNLISDLDSKDRKELGTIFLEKINSRW